MTNFCLILNKGNGVPKILTLRGEERFPWEIFPGGGPKALLAPPRKDSIIPLPKNYFTFITTHTLNRQATKQPLLKLLPSIEHNHKSSNKVISLNSSKYFRGQGCWLEVLLLKSEGWGDEGTLLDKLIKSKLNSQHHLVQYKTAEDGGVGRIFVG